MLVIEKNFPKNSDGKYQNLNFDTLVKIESLDTYLREVLFDMCLDIEHVAKTNLMTMITNNNSEDGYSLIEEFSRINPDKYAEILNRFKKVYTKKICILRETKYQFGYLWKLLISGH